MNTLNKNIKTLTLVIGLTVVFASCSNEKNQTKKESAAISVLVSTPINPEGQVYFNASGQIEAEHFAQISTRNMGYVKTIYVSVGDQVTKGQALIDINNSDLQAKKAQAVAATNQAQASWLIAQKDYERYSRLYEQNSASQKEYDDITTRYKVAQSQLEAAQQVQNEVDAMLAYSNIKAPFSGIITAKMVNVGDMAKPGEILLSLEQKGNFIATARVSEKDINKVKQNDSVRVHLKSEDKMLDGVITEVSRSSQHTGGQYLVKISLNQDSNIPLYSGMYVNTIFSSDSNEDGGNILIPEASIIRRGGLEGIYTVSNSNTAVLRWLKLGKNLNGQVEVLSGLNKDEKIIVEADGKLYNGALININ